MTKLQDLPLAGAVSSADFVYATQGGISKKQSIAALGSGVRRSIATPNGSALDRSMLQTSLVETFKDASKWFQWDFPVDGYTGVRWIANTPSNQNFGDVSAGDTYIYAQPGDGTVGVTFNEPAFGGLRLRLYERTPHNWVCGLLSSTDRNAAGWAPVEGYWEITCKLPNGQGPWSGYWFGTYNLGQVGGNQPFGPTLYSYEIDVFEHYGKWSKGWHTTIHMWPPAGYPDISFNDVDMAFWPLANGSVQNVWDEPPTASTILTTQFNKFGVLVDQNFIRFYFNDIQTRICVRHPLYRFPITTLLSTSPGGAGGQQPPISGTGPFDFYVTNLTYSTLAAWPA